MHDKHVAAAIGAIQTINNLEALVRVDRALRRRFDTLQRRAKLEFNVGDMVSFETASGKMVGRVSKLLTKNIRVTVAGRMWRVSPSLLTKENKS